MKSWKCRTGQLDLKEEQVLERCPRVRKNCCRVLLFSALVRTVQIETRSGMTGTTLNASDADAVVAVGARHVM